MPLRRRLREDLEIPEPRLVGVGVECAADAGDPLEGRVCPADRILRVQLTEIDRAARELAGPAEAEERLAPAPDPLVPEPAHGVVRQLAVPCRERVAEDGGGGIVHVDERLAEARQAVEDRAGGVRGELLDGDVDPAGHIAEHGAVHESDGRAAGIGKVDGREDRRGGAYGPGGGERYAHARGGEGVDAPGVVRGERRVRLQQRPVEVGKIEGGHGDLRSCKRAGSFAPPFGLLWKRTARSDHSGVAARPFSLRSAKNVLSVWAQSRSLTPKVTAGRWLRG